jgi:hypothetical protein
MSVSRKTLQEALTSGVMLEIPAEAVDALSDPAGRVRYVHTELARRLSRFGIIRHGSLLLSSLAPVLGYLHESQQVDLSDTRVTVPQPALRLRGEPELAVSFERVDGASDWAAAMVDAVPINDH